MNFTVNYFSDAHAAVPIDDLNLMLGPGSYQFTQELSKWTFANAADTITYAIKVSNVHIGQTMPPGSHQWGQVDDVGKAPPMKCWNMSDNNEAFLVFPTVAFLPDGTTVPVEVSMVLNMNNADIFILMPEHDTLRYSFFATPLVTLLPPKPATPRPIPAPTPTRTPAPTVPPTPVLAGSSVAPTHAGLNLSTTHPDVTLCYDSSTCSSGIKTVITPVEVARYEPYPSTAQHGFDVDLASQQVGLLIDSSSPIPYMTASRSFMNASKGSMAIDSFVNLQLSLVASVPAVVFPFNYVLPRGTLVMSMMAVPYATTDPAGTLNYTFILETSSTDMNAVAFADVTLRPVSNDPSMLRLNLCGLGDVALLPTQGFDAATLAPVDVDVTIQRVSYPNGGQAIQVMIGLPLTRMSLRYGFFVGSSVLNVVQNKPPASKVLLLPNNGEFDLCFDDSHCGNSTVRVNPTQLAVYTSMVAYSWFAETVGLLSAAQKFPELVTETYKDDSRISVQTSSLTALVPVPVNGTVLEGFTQSHPVVTCTLTHFTSRGQAFDETYLEPIPSGSVQVSYAIENWPVMPTDFSVNLTLSFVNVAGTWSSDSIHMGDIVEGSSGNWTRSRRFYLDDRTFLIVPMQASDGFTQRYAVWSQLIMTSPSILELRLGFPPQPTIKYSLLMSSTLFTSLVHTPTPTPAPTVAPTESPTATVTEPNTTLLTEDFATVTMCFSRDCNAYEGLLMLSMNTVAANATFDDSVGEFVNGTIVGHFGKLLAPTEMDRRSTPGGDDRRFPAATLDSVSHPTKKTTKLLVCMFPGLDEFAFADVSTETEFSYNASAEHFRAAIQVDQFWTNSSLSGALDTVNTSKGGFQVSFEMLVPQGTPMMTTTVSLLISAYEEGDIVTKVSQTQQLNVVRVDIGKSMYLNFPTHVVVGNNSHVLTIVTTYHGTGDFAGLIEIQVHFDSVVNSAAFVGYATSDSIDNRGGLFSSAGSHTAAEAAAAQFDALNQPPPTATDGVPLDTKLLLLPRGQFGMCYDVACNTTTKVAFTGLGLVVYGEESGRFADTSAFQFSPPELVVQGRTKIWRSSFQAIVPNSFVRPPMPLTSAIYLPSDAVFGVTVDQYLSAGTAANGNQVLSLPRGAVKFSVNISNWHFESPNDTLALTIALASLSEDFANVARDASAGVDEFATEDRDLTARVWFHGANYVDFPREAVVDGIVQPISIALTGEDRFILSLRFPAFNNSVYYDPVFSSTALDTSIEVFPSMRVRTTAAHSTTKLRREVAMALLVILGYMWLLTLLRLIKRVPIKAKVIKLMP